MAGPFKQALSYFNSMTDAVTGDKITEATTIVNLHKPDEDTGPGKLIAALTGVARPAKYCYIVSEDGEVLGVNHTREDPSPYYLLLTVNRLLTAPVVRLECVIPNKTPGKAPSKMVLEFPFTDEMRESKRIALKNFEFRSLVERYGRRKDEIVFTSFGAACAGLVNAEKKASVHGEEVARVLQFLRGLLKNDNATPLRFRFFDRVELWDSVWPLILPYILGSKKLPSLSLPAWSALNTPKPERTVMELMNASASYPFVQFETATTFTTPTQAFAELYESARLQYLEQYAAVCEWKSVDHYGILYKIGGATVMAVSYGKFKKLGGDSAGNFELPEKIRVMMKWENKAGDHFSVRANRTTMPVNIPTEYNALFIIKNPNDKVREACALPYDDSKRGEVLQVHVTSTDSKFTLTAKLNTAINLMHPDASRWYKLILNNDCTALEKVDMAMARVEGVELTSEMEEAVEEAYQWMLKFTKWNKQQHQTLESIRTAAGGMVLITGTAGTGKTLIIQVISFFFYKLGLHVLFLAPANTNVNSYMQKLNEVFPEVESTRVFPSSKSFSPEKISKSRGGDLRDSTKGPPQDDDDCDLLEFEMVREDIASRDKFGEFEDCGLAAQVLAVAREGKVSHFEEVAGVKTDVFEALRGFISKSESGTFDWRDAKEVQKYQHAFDACSAYHISLRRLIATTTGNVRCETIINNWALEKNGLQCKGIVIVLDEACKDTEVDTLSAILQPNYRDKITGIVMLGDERQLEPCNTSASGKLSFNPFHGRLSMPLLTRLKSEGFPCTELVYQHRMNAHVAKFPSLNFYEGNMLNGPGTDSLLKPGLHHITKTIISRIDPTFDSTVDPVSLDQALRCHYFQVPGTRDSSKQSPFVREHVRFFFEHLFWGLHSYFGELMYDNVMIIVAYKGSKTAYKEAMNFLQKKFQIPSCQFPQLLTIDSCQGCEAPVTIVDCAIQRYEQSHRFKNVGFVDDDKRMNVAFTRAQEVRWVIGGNCSQMLRGDKSKEIATPAYVRYRDEVEGTPELSKIQTPLIAQGEKWHNKLEKNVVRCAIKYRDEVEKKKK